MGKKYITKITQDEVKILTAKDYDGYKPKSPGRGWVLVQYINLFELGSKKPIRCWTPDYTLQYEKISDFSKVKIIGV